MSSSVYIYIISNYKITTFIFNFYIVCALSWLYLTFFAIILSISPRNGQMLDAQPARLHLMCNADVRRWH